jgi:crotonobetainyl-CoA:carnitine CoA-transferase CaiB-like acyl-CoA transferase
MGVLDGIKVVDFTWAFSGALTSMVLADNGAEVIKVEPPEGDPLRTHPAFPMWHRGKKSVVLDLKSREGRENARELALDSDVVIEHFRPGVAKRLGLDYDELAAVHPGLIWCSITGFGPKGPLAHLQGYEALVAAKSGVMASAASRPTFPPIPYASYSASQAALQGILAALHVRHTAGKGQRVQTSLVQAVTAQDPWNTFIQHLTDTYPGAFQTTPRISTTDAPHSNIMLSLPILVTKDGKWLQFAQLGAHLFRAMVRALGLEWVFQDPQLKSAPFFENRATSDRFWDLLITTVRGKTYAEWMEIFQNERDVSAEMFRTFEEAKEHPQMQFNKHIIEFNDPKLGKTRQLGPLVTFLDDPFPTPRPAPSLGEQTKEVLRRLKRSRPTGVSRDIRSTNGAPLPRHPLEGITVLELGFWYAAPFGPTLLADLGARVIKPEPLRGDDIRNNLPIPESAGARVMQGKESLAVDIATPQGLEIIYKIAEKVDLVMCSWRKGVAERRGLDYESLRKINPRLVYLLSPAYGIDGPCADLPVFAPSITAAVGGMLFQGGLNAWPSDPDLDFLQIKEVLTSRPSGSGGGGNADGVAALGVATGLLLGLVARERTGKGYRLMTTMLCSNAYSLSEHFVDYQGRPPAPMPDPELYGFGPLYRLYQAKEGWVFLACPQQGEWERFCKAVHEATGGHLRFAENERFKTAESRQRHADELAEALAALFRQRTAREWESHFRRFDVACVEINQTPTAKFQITDPVMAENGYLDVVEHPLYGEYPRLGPIVHFSRTPGLSRPGCMVGQHTVAILEELGYSEGAIQQLEEQGVIATSRIEPAVPGQKR